MMLARALRDMLGASLLAAVFAAPAPLAERPQASSRCGTDPVVQTLVLNGVRRILTSADEEGLRTRLGIAGLSADAALSVSDARVCARAAQRINYLDGDNRRDRMVYVVEVGSVRAVHDPSFQLGEWSPLVFFDSHWKVLETLLAF